MSILRDLRKTRALFVRVTELRWA
ncbi:Protein of unknown function [Lactobacillus helveticus CIRM-BIA 951]|uniref:Uncharacterized protein n=1 Tax=Lactobacillus helveticus CIRM-BIA 951 TaxID=1226334 RepID=U6F1R8_LACHE|nr:Protein of unknown function [Lactobacillus helveticus CIRM-BIA 951]